jgi:GNAT superfamily N-acetyltransferase
VRAEIALHRQRPIPAADVVRLYREVAWWPERAEATVAAALGSSSAVGAWDGERLVGFARAVSDGAFRAFVEDVVVSGSHRRRGIASALVAALLDELAGVDVITTFCDEAIVSLYEIAGCRRSRQAVLHLRTADRDA